MPKLWPKLNLPNPVDGTQAQPHRHDAGDISGTFTNVVFSGDLWSTNWSGAIPADLATADATATAGFYMDSSVGAAQFAANVYFGQAGLPHLSIITDISGTRLLFYSTTPHESIPPTIETFGPGIISDPKLQVSSGDHTTTGYNSSLSLDVGGATLGGVGAAGAYWALSTNPNRVLATVPYLAPYGAAGAPGIAWASDTDTGLWGADGKVQVSTAGTTRLTVDTSGVTSTLPIYLPYGDVANPQIAWGGDTDTGLWGAAAHISASIAGTEIVHIDAAGLNVIGTLSQGGTAVSLSGHAHAIYTLIDGTTPFTGKQGFDYGVVGAPGIYWASDVDTGIYGAAAQVNIGTSAVVRLTISDTFAQATVPIKLPDGTALAPALLPTSDVDTGLFFVAATPKVGVTTAGTERLGVTSTSVVTTVPIYLPNGAVGTPSLVATADTHTGLFFPAEHQLGLVADGATRATVSTTALTLPAGVHLSLDYESAGDPSIYPTSDIDTGIFFAAAKVGISTAGAERLGIATAGITAAVPIIHPVGTALLPSITFTGDLDTGIWSAADTLYLSTGGTTRLTQSTTATTLTLPLLLANGTAAAPTLAASGDTHTGIAYAADQLIFSTAGTQRMDVSTTFVTSTLPSKNPDGTAAAPAILPTSDVDTGLFFAAAKVGVTTAGTERLGIATAGITAAVPVLAPYGSAAAPSLAWSADTDTGIWGVDGHVSVSTAGTERVHVDSGGLDIKSGDIKIATVSLKLDHLADTTIGAVTAGRVIRADGTDWHDAQLATTDLSDYTDTTFTPALTASVTNPTLGADAVPLGDYVKVGKQVTGHGYIRFLGAGAAAGSGTYAVSLPVNAATAVVPGPVGLGWAIDWSTGAYQTFVLHSGGTNLANLYYTGAGTAFTHALPWAWVSGDIIYYAFAYKAAA